MADLRRRRRRPHRGRDRRPDRRASPGAPSRATRRYVRVILFDAGPEILAAFDKPVGDRPPWSADRRGDHCSRCRLSATPDAEGVEVEGQPTATRTLTPARHQGLPASQRRPSRGMWPRRPAPSVPGRGGIKVLPDCTLPGHPGGLRHRGHDGARRPAGRGGGRHAVRHPRCPHDQAAAARDRSGGEALPDADVRQMAAVSRRRAIVSFKGLHFSGFIGGRCGCSLHVHDRLQEPVDHGPCTGC